jgi:ATP-dependent Clp protease ATP-binding subunit ClpX
MTEVDTKNILFIAGGAFVGLSDVVKSRLKGSNIGFSAEVKSKEDNTALDKLSPDDLTRFGMIPEFIGRFTTTIGLTDLDKSQLVKVLTEVKNNFIEQYQYLFELDGVKLMFDKEAIEQIADNCIKLKTGARGLQTEIERVLMPHMFHVSQYKKNDITEINITQDLVNNPKTLI